MLTCVRLGVGLHAEPVRSYRAQFGRRYKLSARLPKGHLDSIRS